MPPPPSDEPSGERVPGPRPLSRRASRLFVIAAILFIIAATLGGTYYLLNVTSRALEAPADTSVVDTTRNDTPAVTPDALR